MKRTTAERHAKRNFPVCVCVCWEVLEFKFEVGVEFCTLMGLFLCSQSHYWGHRMARLVSLQSTSLTGLPMEVAIVR